MGGILSADQLEFTDLVNDVPHFLDRDGNYAEFIESDLGKAQIRSLGEQFEEKGLAEPTPEQVKMLLFSAQSAQSTGYRQPDMSHEELMAQHGSTWDHVTGLAREFADMASGVADMAYDAAEAVVGAVRTSPPGEVLDNRENVLDRKLDSSSHGPKF